MKKLDKILLTSSLLYLLIPIIFQLFYWVNRYISIPLIILLVIGFYFVLKRIKPLKEDEYKKIFQKKKILIFLFLIIILSILSGAGGIFQQNWDYHGRNAIFHDLIDKPWPVMYDYSNLGYESSIFGGAGALNYYFAFWLPGAFIGKFIGFAGASIFMLVWQTVGFALFFYLVIRFMKNVKYRYFFIFLAFSGIDVIGNIIMNSFFGTPISPIGITHIDTSTAPFCMSSFVTQLFWVFNQSIPAWIIVMYFMQEKDYKTCGYLFALLVPFGPFPMIGFLFLVFCHIVFGKDLKTMITWQRIKELCSVPNFFGVAAIIPIALTYTLNKSLKGCFIIRGIENGKIWEYIFTYIIFVMVEFLVYIVIINKKNKRQLLMCFAFFAIAPLFYIGGSDLGNRSTIPLLIILYLLIIQFMDKIHKKDNKVFLRQKLLIVILLVAFVTNFNEIYRSFYKTYTNKRDGYSNFSDSYGTFASFENKECSTFITNFVAPYDSDNYVFKYLHRGKPGDLK